MIISPATIHVVKSIASVPKTASHMLQGSMSVTTIAPPHAVFAVRSDTPATCSNGMRPSRTSETPSMTGVAVPELRPENISAEPSKIATPASTSRRRRRPVAGSGRFRIAVETFMTLTRHAETATTTSVSSIPSAKAMARLRGATANSIWRPSSSSAAANALAITVTMPSATSAPSSAPTSAASEVVRDSFEREHLDEVPAPRTDRPRDAELSAPLGGEHHEDQEDEEDSGRDRERAEGREEGHERVAGRRRRLRSRRP